MNLLKAGFYTSISTATRVLAGLVLVKLIAIYVGPTGLGKMGQFMSMLTFLSIFSGGGITTGITKYVAEYRDSPTTLSQLLGTSVSFTLIASGFIGAFILYYADFFAQWLLGSVLYTPLFRMLAFAQFFMAANNFFVAWVNGFKDVSRLMWLNVVGTLVGVMMMAALVIHNHLYGALLGLIVMQAILVFITVPFVIPNHWFKWKTLTPRWNKAHAIALSRYSLITLTIGLVTPFTQIIVRNYLAHTFSWDIVGYWQGVTKISDVYLLFVTTSLTAYYLPRLAELKSKQALKQEIMQAYKIIIPATMVLALAVYLFRNIIIALLFSKEFITMQSLFAMQLIGDVFKISAWLLSFVMLAKAMTRVLFITEILFGCLFVALTQFLTPLLGINGVTAAFAINSFVYLLVMMVVFYDYLRRE